MQHRGARSHPSAPLVPFQLFPPKMETHWSGNGSPRCKAVTRRIKLERHLRERE